MADEMLFLANLGCDVMRLDALAFVWKEQGTDCENLPKAHSLIRAFNLCMQIVAPGVVFKSEAIVHPDRVVEYIDKQECQTSYNPLLMALLWNSLATRKTRLLQKSLSYRFSISDSCNWVNYVRCHDDIGWTFDDGDAGELGINGYDHRLFLNKFYTGDFPGSFSTGMGFQFNPDNGDCRVCGSLASLCGLEKALKQNDQPQIDMALARMNLIHSVIISIGGIPLLYQGDELATLNDYSFLEDESKRHDARWVNRPKITDQDRAKIEDKQSIAAYAYQSLKFMIDIRKNLPVMGDGTTQIYQLDHPHLFAYSRFLMGTELHCMMNFSDVTQRISSDALPFASNKPYPELLSSQAIEVSGLMELSPYQVLWLYKS
jgi:amylosucrase